MLKNSSRREFLLQSSLALSAAAAAPHLLSQSNSAPRIRGLMLDAARVPEPLPYYRRVIDFCADWDLNAIHFRIADDQGCAIRFSSVPDLLFHPNAVTPGEISDLARYAHSRGVDLIPELESFGHTGFITRAPAYAHLLDAESPQSSEFTGIIPVHPHTLPLFRKLYREISTIFPSPYLHGGCDEVNWGGSALSRKALQSRQRHQIWADYLNSLNAIAESCKKEFIVWGDMVLHKDPRILAALDKKIIIMDWNYTEGNSAKVQDALSAIRANGSRALGAPALISYRCGPRAGTTQLANIDAFADVYLSPQNSNSLGVILTNWVPSRWIQNSIWDGFAYAAVAFRDGLAVARNSAFRRFVEKHYGATWNDTWSEVFRLIYHLAPQVEHSPSESATIPLRIPFSTDQQLSAVLHHPAPRSNPFTHLHTLLPQLGTSVTKNEPDFRAFELSIAYLDHVYDREITVLELAANRPLTRDTATAAIRDIAQRDRTLAQFLTQQWDRNRFPNSSAKSQPLYGFQPKDQLLFQFQRAANYSAALAANPDRFFRLLAVAKPA